MFAPSHSGAYVCLRCQSQSLTARKFFAATRTVPPSRRYLYESRRRLESPANTARKIYPHGKLRGKKGGEVRESSEVLPVSTLGKPAEIILLRDAELDRAKEEADNTPKAPPRPRKSSKKEIFDSVARGTVVVDKASTTRSIEELRDTTLGRVPEKGDSIAQEQHERLIKGLEDGFTSSQLRLYATQKGNNLLVRSVKETEKLPHSDWTVGTSPSDEKHLILSSVSSRKTISKAKFARLIVERGWQLHVDNAMDVGEIDVYDAQSFLQARNEYGMLILDQIAEARRVKMHTLTEKVLRITGDRESATAALNDISQKCLTVRSEKLRLNRRRLSRDHQSTSTERSDQPESHAPSANFISLAARASIGAQELEVLKSTTGVRAAFIVDKRDHKPYLKLDGYSPEQMNDARRAVASMSNIATRSTQSFKAFLELDSPRGPVTSSDTLPYHHRSISRHRSVSEVPRQATQSEDSKLPVEEDAIQTLTDAALANSCPENTSEADSQVWAPHTDISFTSRLGSVIWPQQTAGVSNRSGAVFTPGLAHLPPFISFLSSTLAAVPATSNIISFAFRHDPVPPSGSDRNTKQAFAKANWENEPLPEVKFEFQLDPTGGNEPHLLSIRAITWDHSLCTSLPDKPIDFSVTEKHTRIFKHGNDLVKQAFTPVINAMKSSIQGADRLRAPPSINIPVPRTWWTQDVEIVSSLPTYKTDGSSDTLVKAHYSFVGVEHRQIIPFEIDGVQHQITTVEGGKLGATYTELSVVQPPAFEGSEKTELAESRKTMLRNAVVAGLKMVEIAERAATHKLNLKGSEAQTDEASAAEAVVAEESPEEDTQTVEEPVTEEMPEEESVEDRRAAASG